MSNPLLLKKKPNIEFHFLEHGFQLNDTETALNSGFYSYQEIQSVVLHRVWFPRLSVWMRVFTTFLNGVPFFPDADSYKFSSIVIQTDSLKIGIWLTNTTMAKQAKKLKEMLDKVDGEIKA